MLVRICEVVVLYRTVMKICALLVVLCGVGLSSARPQGGGQQKQQQYAPMPYDFEYKVEDAPTQNYFGQQEQGNEQGRVDGSYYVLLADGRLMTVTYYVDGESGFVPKITFQKDARPFGG